MKRKLKIIAGALVISYLLGLIALTIFETRILFWPRTISETQARVLASENIQEVWIPVDDTQLHGWLVNAKDDNPLIIYYGGNAEEVSNMIHFADNFSGYSLLLMNYRGYGLSGGRPNEENLKEDAEIVYDYIKQRLELTPQDIFVRGAVLGRGLPFTWQMLKTSIP